MWGSGGCSPAFSTPDDDDTVHKNVHVLAPSGKVLHFKLPAEFGFDDLRLKLETKLEEEDMNRMSELIELNTENLWFPGNIIKFEGDTWLLFHQDTSVWHAWCMDYLHKLVDGGI